MTDNPTTHYQKVLEFYKAFNQALPEPDSKPSLHNELMTERIDLKMGLIAEEFFELIEAVYGKASAEAISSAWPKVLELDDNTRDIVEFADALADLDYVINGAAIEAKVDLDELFDEVHASNMSKLGADGLPILATGEEPEGYPKGKILKGPDFWRPDVPKILGLTED